MNELSYERDIKPMGGSYFGSFSRMAAPTGGISEDRLIGMANSHQAQMGAIVDESLDRELKRSRLENSKLATEAAKLSLNKARDEAAKRRESNGSLDGISSYLTDLLGDENSTAKEKRDALGAFALENSSSIQANPVIRQAFNTASKTVSGFLVDQSSEEAKIRAEETRVYNGINNAAASGDKKTVGDYIRKKLEENDGQLSDSDKLIYRRTKDVAEKKEAAAAAKAKAAAAKANKEIDDSLSAQDKERAEEANKYLSGLYSGEPESTGVTTVINPKTGKPEQKSTGEMAKLDLKGLAKATAFLYTTTGGYIDGKKVSLDEYRSKIPPKEVERLLSERASRANAKTTKRDPRKKSGRNALISGATQ